jgi:hopanoid-associated phosphorylase
MTFATRPEKPMRGSVAQTLVIVVGLPFEARLAGAISGRVICGGNGQNLAASLTCAIMNECRGLISLGVAGGLLPNLSAGTCVVGSEIVWGTQRLMTDPSWSQRLLHAIPDSIYGKIVGVAAPIVYTEAKHSLYVTTRAVAVDMESHIVASAAAANGLPFVAIRIIADPAEHPLPQVALAAMRPNGTINIAKLALSLMKDPRDFWSLLQTAQDAFAARAKLRHVCTAFGSCQDRC